MSAPKLAAVAPVIFLCSEGLCTDEAACTASTPAMGDRKLRFCKAHGEQLEKSAADHGLDITIHWHD